MIINLEDLKVYQIAMEIGEEVWKVVSKWDHFSKIAVGSQWIRAADSIAANISSPV